MSMNARNITSQAGSQPSRMSREASQALTRANLMQAATRLFIEKGYGGASIRDIVELAGYTQGAFYSNYESKESLLLEMLRKHMQNEAAQLADLLADENSSVDAMFKKLEDWAAGIDRNMDWSMLSTELQLHARRSADFAKQYQTIWMEHKAVLAHWIAQIFSKCNVQAPLACDQIASICMAIAHGLSLQRAATGDAAPVTALIVVLRGLIAAGGAPAQQL